MRKPSTSRYLYKKIFVPGQKVRVSRPSLVRKAKQGTVLPCGIYHRKLFASMRFEKLTSMIMKVKRKPSKYKATRERSRSRYLIKMFVVVTYLQYELSIKNKRWLILFISCPRMKQVAPQPSLVVPIHLVLISEVVTLAAA
jgi:hypothetical protein